MHLALLVLVLGVVAGLAWLLSGQGQIGRSVDRLAEELGFTLSPNQGLMSSGSWTLRGRWRGLDAAVRFVRRDLRDSRVSTLVEVGPAHPGLGLGRREASGGAAKGAVLTGDPEFDALGLVWGDETVVRALLDAPTRAAALAVLQYPVAVVSGGAVSLGEEGARLSASDAGELLDEAAALCERIGPGAFDEERLFAVAVEDPVPGVRARALAALWRCGSPDHVALAGDSARCDPDPAVRALGVIMSEDPDRVVSLSSSALRLAAAVTPSSVTHVLGVMRDEHALLDLLEHDEQPVVLAAIHTLGAMGSADAAEALQPLRSGLTRDREIKAAARAALRRLQERHGAAQGEEEDEVEEGERARPVEASDSIELKDLISKQ